MPWLAGGLAVALWVGFSLASTNLDRMQSLAGERYGAQAEQTVAAWRRLLEESRGLPVDQQLNAVNTFFNRRIVYELDPAVWQQNDYWATPLEFMGRATGDCEDYAIAKYVTLQMLGVADTHLRLIYVRAKTGSTTTQAHMVLGFFPQPTDEPLVLDSLISSIRPASQRSDLMPLFSFNGAGLWVGGAAQSSADPTARLSRWRDVLERMRQDGMTP